MRIVTIKCDRCGNIIPDKPIKISMEKIRREGPNLGGEFLRELSDLEFCEQCAKDIKRFMIQPLYRSGDGKEGSDMAEQAVDGLSRYEEGGEMDA